MKVVYEDAGASKVAYGNVEFLDDWVQVTQDGKKIIINKKAVTFIREE